MQNFTVKIIIAYFTYTVEYDRRLMQCIELLCGYLTDQYPGDAEYHVIPSCDLHVTVSRTVAIRHHWIEPLMDKLRNGLSKHHRYRYVQYMCVRAHVCVGV